MEFDDTSLSFFFPRPRLKCDLTSNELLSRVYGALPEVAFEHGADLPMCFLSTQQRVHALDVDGLPLVIDESVDILGRTFLVSQIDAPLATPKFYDELSFDVSGALTHMNFLLESVSLSASPTGQSPLTAVHDIQLEILS